MEERYPADSPTPSLPTADALLLAAGSGRRMGDAAGGGNKVFLEVGGIPLFVHSLRKLIRSPFLRRIVVVVRPGEEPFVEEAIGREGYEKEVRLTPGGAERFDSVHNGLILLADDAPDLVLIHDSARPFFPERTIDESLRLAAVHGACTVAVPLTDTLKRRADGMLVETLPREELYRIQTPQTFSYPLLCEAHEAFRRNPVPGVTDDCMLLEHQGRAVALALGDETNLKVTTPFDLQLAEFILRTRPEV